MLLVRLFLTIFCCFSASGAHAKSELKKFEIQVVSESPDETLTNVTVYPERSRSESVGFTATDENGRFDDSYNRAGEPGASGNRYYYVLPYDRSQWQVALATGKALPSQEALEEDQSVLRGIGHRVKATWQESDGKRSLATEPVPRRGSIRLFAQSPSGEPITNHAVQLYSREDKWGSSDSRTVMWSGKTDHEGWITLQRFPGTCDFVVCFPGVGHTQTGLLVVEPGSEIEIRLSRAAPYAKIQGQVAGSLASRIGAYERVYFSHSSAWRYREAPIDEDGSFQIQDVPAGKYRLLLRNTRVKPLIVDLLTPRGDRTNLVIEARGEARAKSAVIYGGATAKQNRIFTLQGRLVDTHGNVVSGATVFAIMKYHGGMRMYQETKEVTTDKNGAYEIEDVNFHYGSVVLIGYVQGHPLAISAGRQQAPPSEADLLDTAKASSEASSLKPLPKVLPQPDLVLPDATQGGRLQVKTLKEGVPQSDVLVKIELMDFQQTFSPHWAAGVTPKSLNDVLTPAKVTDASGTVYFKSLAPGLYLITARMVKQGDVKTARLAPSWTLTSADQVQHVVVASGEQNSVELSINDTISALTPFEIMHPNGDLLSNTDVAISWGSSGGSGGSSSGSDIDAGGIGNFRLQQRGLWRVSVRYLSPTIHVKTVRVRTEPFYLGETHVAVSRLALRSSPLRFHPRLVAPGNITAVIKDEAGNTVPGVVALDVVRHGSFGRNKERFASTDADKSVQFERVKPGQHSLRGSVSNWPEAVASLSMDDAELVHQYAVPMRVVELAPGESTHVELQRQQVAFIRGKVDPLPDPNLSLSMSLEGSWRSRSLDTRIHWSRESGEFIIGPTLPGKCKVGIRHFRDRELVSSATHTFDVEQAGVHREDITYRPQQNLGSRPEVVTIRGRVFLSDGNTPAYSARIRFSSPDRRIRHGKTWSDAQGRFTLLAYRDRYLPRILAADLDKKRDPPATVACWLPGSRGQSRVTLPEDYASAPVHELKVVLPNTASLRGNVSVDGRSPATLPVVITVFAQHQDLSQLGQTSNVMGTANVDGSYKLEGLTPGDYDVQACIDGIWLSLPQQLVVTDKAPSEQVLDFNIPSLGDIGRYRLINSAGKPLANQKVSFEAPALNGPLSRRIRSEFVETDGAAILHLEGHLAGTQRIRIADQTAVIAIPPLGSPMTIPSQVVLE